ncbi:MAG: hypothetical protein K1000chlam3_01297, partial [Chlamydiae bacterium]|nr:hypothetical protein [Chlamydiota bacterium]
YAKTKHVKKRPPGRRSKACGAALVGGSVEAGILRL